MSITAGEGHNATARAVVTALRERGHECRLVDAYKEIDTRLHSIVSRGYLFSVSRLRRAYSGVYSRLEARRRNAYRNSATRLVNRAVSGRIQRTLDDYRPDVIVYTHCFCGILLDVIKEKNGLRPRTVGILTDFAMHPYWEECLRTDYVVIPNDLCIPSARAKGFTDKQIKPIGIPIKPIFAEKTEKREARRAIGLDGETVTLLLMGGSMGYGNLASTVKRLDSLPVELQIICVTGNNAKARAEIEGLRLSKKTVVYGFTDKVGLLMDAADIIISKPGGLTASEALAKRLPMILKNPIPGIEDRNKEFLLNNGVAVAVTKTYSLENAVCQLLKNERRIRAMLDCIDCIRRPYATASLCDLVEQCCTEKCDGETKKG